MKRQERVVMEEDAYQGLPGILKDQGRFCRIIRKQNPVSTKCLALKFRVTKLKVA